MNRTVLSTIPARTMSEGAGAIVHRTIGAPDLDALDPFLLLDEFTSTGGKEGGGFPDHPHRGFETATYMLEGRMEHADNKGHRGIVEPGGMQWMRAGSGLIHSELPANETGGPIRGMQLWVNLPASDKMITPCYQEVGTSEIPEVELASGGKVRVLAGSFEGVSGAATDIAVAPLYLDIHVGARETITIPLPTDHKGFIYGLEGSVTNDDTPETLNVRELGILSSGEAVTLRGGPDGGRFLLIAARPIGEPIARHGPFVMNTREEIVLAFEDFRAGKF